MVRGPFATSSVWILGVLLLAGCRADVAPSGLAPARSELSDSGRQTTAEPIALEESRYSAAHQLPGPAGTATGEPVRRDPGSQAAGSALSSAGEFPPHEGTGPGLGGDKYAYLEENEFLAVRDTPLSTFSIDVDTASYAKTRSYLLAQHRLPPPDAVRIEELINYFDYAYAGPEDEHPFAVHIETGECPWQPLHRLARVGLQGKRLDQQRPVSNLVFLIDVSGSMNAPNRLPLVQRSLGMLVRQLDENDSVAIVVYAGAAGLVLPPTGGTDQPAILAAIENLRAGGSTNGGQGIHLAYGVARQNFIQGGVNRVLLCTDGDFNVGTTSTGDLVRLAEDQASHGIYLSVLGFGFGNHNDAMLEQLSNRANGNYAFIDSDREAHKVLVEQMQGTLVTIAKDVKIQVEFNPKEVAAYRLIGYENRRLADRDFNDDTKDAGDIGAGHSVTALYEIVPVGLASTLAQPGVDPLKYQGPGVEGIASDVEPHEAAGLTQAAQSGELLTLKLRYQPPSGGASTLLTFPVTDSGQRFGSASADFQFSAAVAAFGMLLRNSKHKGDATLAAVFETASAARGEDKQGLRHEFLSLVQAAQRLSGEAAGAIPQAWQPQAQAGGVIIGAPRIVRALFPVALGLSSDRPGQLLAIGIAAGGLLALLALVAGIGLSQLLAHGRSQLLRLPPPRPMAEMAKVTKP